MKSSQHEMGAVAARQQVAADPADPNAVQKVVAAEGVLTQSLGRLFAVAEAYPDLKANQTMLQLQAELTETEIAFRSHGRPTTNRCGIITPSARSFPNSVLAGMFNFAPASLYEIADPGDSRSTQGFFHLNRRYTG